MRKVRGKGIPTVEKRFQCGCVRERTLKCLIRTAGSRRGVVIEDIDVPGDRSLTELFAQGIITIRILEEFCCQILFIMRRIIEAEETLEINQRDYRTRGRKERKLVIERNPRRHTPFAWLKRLESAVGSGSDFRVEKAIIALGPVGELYLARGLEAALQSGNLSRAPWGKFRGRSLGRAVLPAHAARAIVPFAMALAQRDLRNPDRRLKDFALAILRQLFMDISGGDRDELTVYGDSAPTGAGADFVREIEDIFGVELLSKASKHAVLRARKIDVLALGYGHAGLCNATTDDEVLPWVRSVVQALREGP